MFAPYPAARHVVPCGFFFIGLRAGNGRRAVPIRPTRGHATKRAFYTVKRGPMRRSVRLSYKRRNKAAHKKRKKVFMFEKIRIKEHMEVADINGQHVGTVDDVEDNRIKLTKSDAGDNMHHFISLDEVEKIDDNRVYLKASAVIPQGVKG
ncbi:DUF2171 domain-containing protein [Croceicoccus hydrothermalis]|uniref:DUF2171 domain-containing protein n=1 Tax=Croceicoccus hydrothermalis TaxID=2867964 RepID=UPI0030846C7C